METSKTMVETLQAEVTHDNSVTDAEAAASTANAVAIEDEIRSVNSVISLNPEAQAERERHMLAELTTRNNQIREQLQRIAALEEAQRQSAAAADAHAAQLAAANRATETANAQRLAAETEAAQRAAQVAAAELTRQQAVEQATILNAQRAAEEAARVERARQEAETLRQQQAAAAALAAQQAAVVAAATAAAAAAAQTLAAAQQSHRDQMLSVVSTQFSGYPQVIALVESQIQAWGPYIIDPAFTRDQLNMKKNELIELDSALADAALLKYLAGLNT